VAYGCLALSMSLVGGYVALSKPLVAAFPVLLLAWLRFGIAALAMPHWLKRTPDEPPMTARTRWLVLNTPNNPSGTLLSEAELAAIAELAERHDLVHACDATLRRHRHHRPEVSRHLAVGEVAPAIAALGLDESKSAWIGYSST